VIRNDPTVLWPAGRREIKAGTLTLTSYAPDQASGAYTINFDPMHMADGIAPTDDPVSALPLAPPMPFHTPGALTEV